MPDINNLFFNYLMRISKILQIEIYNYYLLWYSSEGLFLYIMFINTKRQEYLLYS